MLFVSVDHIKNSFLFEFIHGHLPKDLEIGLFFLRFFKPIEIRIIGVWLDMHFVNGGIGKMCLSWHTSSLIIQKKYQIPTGFSKFQLLKVSFSFSEAKKTLWVRNIFLLFGAASIVENINPSCVISLLQLRVRVIKIHSWFWDQFAGRSLGITETAKF